jgi:predicted XRE-type DNA-binding protein
MFKKEDLIRTEEYWMENIQNELYFVLKKHMEERELNQTELAKELGFSKSYVSQVLKGNFNHSTKKLVRLLLAIDRVPQFDFMKANEYLRLIDKSSKIMKVEFCKENVSGETLRNETETEFTPYELEM